MSTVTYAQYITMMNRIGYWLVKNNKKITTRDIYNKGNKTLKLAEIKKKLLANGTNYKADTLLARYAEYAIQDNKSYANFPDYVTGPSNVKYYKKTYVDMCNRVIAFERKNSRNPTTVSVQGAKSNNITTKITDATLKKFVETFGSVTDFDSALKRIEGKGYAYYYNSSYNTNTTIARIKAGKGVNCTDSSQLMYRIAKALGYTVQFVHVQCSSGGHIRLRLKHAKNTGGEWIYRDPACVLSNNGKGIRCNWCMDGKINAYDPAWIFSDLYQ